MELSQALATVIVALVAGSFSSLLAPWAKFGLDRRAEQRAARRALIAGWRSALERVAAPRPGDTIQDNPSRLTYEPTYLSLRQHLEPELIERLENPGVSAKGTQQITIQTGAPTFDPRLIKVAAAIDRLEGDWQLV